MSFTNSRDRDRLFSIYWEEPCQTLPNAFWKSKFYAGSTKLEIRHDQFGDYRSLALWNDDRLMSLWFDDPQYSPLTKQQTEVLRFALVHNQALSVFNLQRFSERTAYFRLRYAGVPPENDPPPGFVFETFDPKKDILTGVSLISACYPNMKISEEVVQGWMRHPVYDPRLWVWIREIQTGRYAALGIAELDPRFVEASLEWIQVHPDYQGKGLGKAIVGELLYRVRDEAAFTTVSGEVDNPSHPEALYRQCGFSGSDIWWLLKA